MSELNNLFVASFRGVRFLWKSDTTTGGRKQVVHEYPNTNRRNIEDLGKLQRIFTMEAIIIGPNLRNNRDALIEALEKPGKGILVHPHFGSILVASRPYIVRHSDTTLGIVEFTLTFDRTSEQNIFPQVAKQQQSFISNTVDNIVSLLETDFTEKFKSVSNVIQNFNDAKAKISNFIDDIERLGNSIRQIAGKVNQFANDILIFRNEINNLLSAPQELVASISNLYATFAVIAENPFSQFNIFEGLYNFGVNDEEITTTAQISIDRQDNRDTINFLMQTEALIFSYENVLDLGFETTTQIDDIRNILETQFLNIIENINFEISQEIKDLLYELRQGVNNFLDDKSVITPRVITIETQTISLDNLVYKYYGNLDNYEIIKGLNSFDNISFIEGEVKILSQ